MSAVAVGYGREIAITGPHPRLRVVGALTAIIVAYHWSLYTLVRNLDLDTPLAYLGLVPPVALAVAAHAQLTHRDEPAVYDRQVDYLVGLPLLGAAVAFVWVQPARMSVVFWTYRVDMLSLPMFAAGVVALLFGARVLWRLRTAMLFMLFAWPWPWRILLDHVMRPFTDLTVHVLQTVLGWLPVAAESLPGGDGSVFRVHHGASSFLLSVGPACSGANGAVAFLLAGTAFALLARGPRWRKLLWLGTGLLLLWTLNVVRLVAIFAVGERWGEDAALGWLHPYVGLALFAAGVAAMAMAAPKIGLRLATRSPETSTRHHGMLARESGATGSFHAVAHAGVAALVVIAAAGLAATANARLSDFGLISGDLGDARLIAFTDHQATPPGWSADQTAQYDWARRYFGHDSTWTRYTYTADASTGPIRGMYLLADVISTEDRRRLVAYGIDACYRFHGYDIRQSDSVAVGGGVRAQALSFYNRDQKADWSALWWEWPVRAGAHTRWERVVLLMPDSEWTDMAGAENASTAARSFLASVARAIVAGQPALDSGGAA